MGSFNRYAILAILAISLVALCGAADAKPALPLSVSVDTIQINGHYLGTPTLLGNVPGYYGYTYDIFVPDGTYTVMGTITNKNADNAVNAWVGIGLDDEAAALVVPAKPTMVTEQDFNLKPDGSADFALTFAADSIDDIIVYYGYGGYYAVAKTSGAEIVNQEDLKKHTVDQGPMSNAVAIYSNGKLTYNGLPQYWAYI